MPLAIFLLALVGPLAKKILLALGISAITYTGLMAIFTVLQGQVTSAIGGLSSDFLAMASMTGFVQAVSITLGAVTTRLSMATFTRWIKS